MNTKKDEKQINENQQSKSADLNAAEQTAEQEPSSSPESAATSETTAEAAPNLGEGAGELTERETIQQLNNEAIELDKQLVNIAQFTHAPLAHPLAKLSSIVKRLLDLAARP